MTEPQEPEKPPTLMKLSDLKKMIGDFVNGAFDARDQRGTQDPEPTGRRQPARGRREEPQGRSVQDEVDAALKKLDAEKADREWRESLRKDVDEVKEKTKERAPVERRRVHRIMRWGE